MKTDRNGVPLYDGAMVVMDGGFQVGEVDLSVDPGPGFVWVLFEGRAPNEPNQVVCETARLVMLDRDTNWSTI